MSKSAMKFTYSVWKWSAVPNWTGKVIYPKGWDALPGTIPQNGESTGTRSSFVRPNSVRAPAKRILRALPPSMRTFLNRTLQMVGFNMTGKCPMYGISAHWLALLNVIGYSD